MNKPLEKRILGIDYGKARIGLALSDAMRIIASPLETIKADKKILQTVQAIKNLLETLKAKGQEVSQIVIGLPLHMNGKMSHMSDEAAAFAQSLEEATSLPVITFDERLTSVQAEKSLQEANLNRKKRAQHVDSVAAVLILQSYLDSLDSPVMMIPPPSF